MIYVTRWLDEDSKVETVAGTVSAREWCASEVLRLRAAGIRAWTEFDSRDRVAVAREGLNED